MGTGTFERGDLCLPAPGRESLAQPDVIAAAMRPRSGDDGEQPDGDFAGVEQDLCARLERGVQGSTALIFILDNEVGGISDREISRFGRPRGRILIVRLKSQRESFSLVQRILLPRRGLSRALD